MREITLIIEDEITNKTIKIKQLCQYIIYHCKTNDNECSHNILQRLLYYINAWHVVYFNKQKLFADQCEYWVSGPAYRKVHELYGGEYSVQKFNNITNGLVLDISQDQQELIDEVISKYVVMGDFGLTLLVMKEKPWNHARRKCGMFEMCEERLSIDYIYESFSGRLNQKK